MVYTETPSTPAGLTFVMDNTGLVTALNGNVAPGLYAVSVTCNDGFGAASFTYYVRVRTDTPVSAGYSISNWVLLDSLSG